MLWGVGTDIIEIDRITKVIERFDHRFLQRVFTPREIETARGRGALFNAALAARFAAKEAILKALGTGLRGLKWVDIEIVSRESGRPEVVLRGEAEILAGEKNIASIHVSISHCRNYAVAFAAAERNDGFETGNR
ncbi:MAG: holo-ACP synthase [Clostridia bacterium]|nr:holo-ACP synthase [Clostridia bacterium]